jgi:DNA-directed RNA polymerase subunit M/transcription elongation factor TFIIS
MGFLIGVRNAAGDNAKIQADPSRPGYYVVVSSEEEAQRWLDAHKVTTPNGWMLCERNQYVGPDGRIAYDRIGAAAETREHETKEEAAKVRCPKCKSEQIHAEKRGWNVLTGFIGSGAVVITCLKCGHRFKPGQA